jgi:hypothetical protein
MHNNRPRSQQQDKAKPNLHRALLHPEHQQSKPPVVQQARAQAKVANELALQRQPQQHRACTLICSHI